MTISIAVIHDALLKLLRLMRKSKMRGMEQYTEKYKRVICGGLPKKKTWVAPYASTSEMTKSV